MSNQAGSALGRRVGMILGLSLAVVLGLAAGALWRDPILRTLRGTRSAAERADARIPGKQLWTCSMHPQVIREEPGLCPICHMQLTPLKTEGAASTSEGAVTIDPSAVQNMGVRVAVVER